MYIKTARIFYVGKSKRSKTRAHLFESHVNFAFYAYEQVFLLGVNVEGRSRVATKGRPALMLTARTTSFVYRNTQTGTHPPLPEQIRSDTAVLYSPR